MTLDLSAPDLSAPSLSAPPSPSFLLPVLLLVLISLAIVTILLIHLSSQQPFLSFSTEPLARLVLRSLRRGHPPSHVAFIMDGNRRWASSRTLPAQMGHSRGGETLSDVLQWCLDAGVCTVTVYAFSSENFKRPPEEVGAIFALAEAHVHRMLTSTDLVRNYRVRVNVLGDLSALPPALRRTFAEAMRETRAYEDGPTLNICFAYTARAEIARAVGTAVRLCDEGEIAVGDVDEQLLAACLHTGVESGAGNGGEKAWGCGAEDRRMLGFPDLLVRTSGEIRLSDFLLMQASDAVISFRRVLWPDMSAWHLVAIILDYQAQRRAQGRVLKGKHSVSLPPPSKTFDSARVQKALRKVAMNCYARIDDDRLGLLS